MTQDAKLSLDNYDMGQRCKPTKKELSHDEWIITIACAVMYQAVVDSRCSDRERCDEACEWLRDMGADWSVELRHYPDVMDRVIILHKLIEDDWEERMPYVTWKQFKEAIDKQLNEIGLSEDAEIEYMDFSFPDFDEEKLSYSFGVAKSQFDNTFIVR